MPSPDQSVSLLASELKSQELPLSDLFANVKLQVLLDKLFWISQSIKLEGCAKCRPDRIADGQEEIVPPYINRLSWKLLDKTFIDRQAARNISRVAQGKCVVFVDEDFMSVVDLAK